MDPFPITKIPDVEMVKPNNSCNRRLGKLLLPVVDADQLPGFESLGSHNPNNTLNTQKSL